jgi:hypothetical protein
MNLPKLIPLGQSQPFTGYSKAALYLKARAGEITITKIGRKSFLREDEIERFRKANERTHVPGGKVA